MAILLTPAEAYAAMWACAGLLAGGAIGYLFCAPVAGHPGDQRPRKDRPMFNIVTHLSRPNARDSIYRFNGKDAAFLVAVQGALLSVLGHLHTGAVQALAGVVAPDAGGTETLGLTMTVTLEHSGELYYEVPVKFGALSADQVLQTMVYLSEAMRPFRPHATRAKV